MKRQNSAAKAFSPVPEAMSDFQPLTAFTPLLCSVMAPSDINKI